MPETTGTAYAPKPVRQRSFAGPIILIVIGTVFLLANMHVITWSRMVTWFAHWWPLLLIVYGLLKLVEYYSAKHDGTQFRGVGAGGVVLVVFVIMIGLAANGAVRVANSMSGDGPWNGNWGNWFGQEYTYTQTLEQDFPAAANVKVASARGDVNVTVWDQNRIKVEVSKRIHAEGQASADQMDRESQVSVSSAGNEVLVKANNDNRPITTDLQIFVPRKGGVNVETRHGDVLVQGREGNVKITEEHGDVSIQDVTGSADISMRHGDLRVAKVSGDVNLDGRLDDVSVSEVGGNLRMTGEYFGDMSLAKIAKSVSFKTSRTDLQLAKVSGEMNMQSDSLHASAVEGPIKIATRSKDIQLENVSGNIEVSNSNASIQLRAGEKLGQITIDNRNGAVELVLPAKASFQLNAKTEKGDIQSEFSGISTNSQHGDNSASGQVGSGGPRIQINSQHGDVAIKKAS